MTKPVDITNQRFGRLVAIRHVGNDVRSKRIWLCQCDCKNEKHIRAGDLRSGKTKSCGCLQIENGSFRSTHGQTGTPEYLAWAGMLTRCNNPKSSNFEYYGGRGIKVCERWLQYENFFADMGQKPTPTHTLDRINVDGNYEPANCRWATKKEQAKNKRPFIKWRILNRFTTEELESELARRQHLLHLTPPQRQQHEHSPADQL